MVLNIVLVDNSILKLRSSSKSSCMTPWLSSVSVVHTSHLLCCAGCCKASGKSKTNEPNHQSQQLGMPPAYSSSSQQHNNNELALDAESSLGPPVYAEIIRKSVNNQTQPVKSGAEISGFGDVSFGNWSGQDLSPKILNNAVGAPRQSNRTKPSSSRSPQKNTNLSVSGLPGPVDEMDGYINPSYTANDEGNSSNPPRRSVVERKESRTQHSELWEVWLARPSQSCKHWLSQSTFASRIRLRQG